MKLTLGKQHICYQQRLKDCSHVDAKRYSGFPIYLVIGQGAMLGFLEAHFVTCWIRGCGGNTCKASLRGDLLALLGRKKQAGQELVSASF